MPFAFFAAGRSLVTSNNYETGFCGRRFRVIFLPGSLADLLVRATPGCGLAGGGRDVLGSTFSLYVNTRASVPLLGKVHRQVLLKLGLHGGPCGGHGRACAGGIVTEHSRVLVTGGACLGRLLAGLGKVKLGSLLVDHVQGRSQVAGGVAHIVVGVVRVILLLVNGREDIL